MKEDANVANSGSLSYPAEQTNEHPIGQANGHLNGRPKENQFRPITVEKESVQKSDAPDTNNNLSSEEFKDLEKYKKIRELIEKNENLRAFLEKIGALNQTMSSYNKLNELNRLIEELSQNQLELKNESILLSTQVDELKELSAKQDRLLETKSDQDELLERADWINRKLHDLSKDYREQNSELKQNLEKLVRNLSQSLAQV